MEPMPEPGTCPRCGNPVTEGAATCAFCGAPLGAAAGGTGSAPPPPPPSDDAPLPPAGAAAPPPPPPGSSAPSGYAPGYAPGYAAAPGYVMVSGKRVTAGVLGILLGAWGIHRFYLGDTVGGILRIVITLATCGIGGIIGFIEGIIYLTKSDQEFDYVYLVQRKEWF